jgi:hypothetical protein
MINTIPGSRRIFKPLLLYFTNFDDLMLYDYHEKLNDIVLQEYFKMIILIQN